ncbi:MAG TPA: response regulator [Thermoanaerobaculia bacterium]|jgi:DNA-binding response OmpR family regulator|nr:response regulator [Thermoanaerobaculia bacterium]
MSRDDRPYVLVADDDEPTCTLLTALLHREFNVDIAIDGQHAIDRLRSRQYAAILIDLRMPQTDGFAALDFLKEHQPGMLASVLVVTATLTRDELDRARSYGVCDIIVKPFEVETLLAAVKKCVYPDGGNGLGPILYTGGPMIFLLADLLRQRLL